jgi:hypothetical protein
VRGKKTYFVLAMDVNISLKYISPTSNQSRQAFVDKMKIYNLTNIFFHPKII